MPLTYQESTTYQVLLRASNNDSIPFYDQIFDSDEDAYNFYSMFAKKNGFSIRHEHVIASKEQGIYRGEFVCHRSGIARSKNIQELD